MGQFAARLRVAATLLTCLATVNGQEGSTNAGPVWVHADFETSPPVYPSRKHYTSKTTETNADVHQQTSPDLAGRLRLRKQRLGLRS